jgi:hypothetical protein
MEYFDMTAPKKPTNPPVDDEGQVTPSADALVEDESAGAGTSLAQIAAALRAAGVSASRQQIDRAFTRDAFDTDIGYHEGIRACLLMNFQGLTALENSFSHVKAVKAMNNEDIQQRRAVNAQTYDNVLQSDSTFHSGLLKAYGLETDNEVLSTIALAKAVDNMLQRLDKIEGAIAAAG